METLSRKRILTGFKKEYYVTIFSLNVSPFLQEVHYLHLMPRHTNQYLRHLLFLRYRNHLSSDILLRRQSILHFLQVKNKMFEKFSDK